MLMRNLFQRKPIADESAESGLGLRRSLGAWQLMALGIGAIIGAGIFSGAGEVIELTNISTLFAFVLVAAGVLVLRIREPERHRPFRTPAVWIVAPAAILSCAFLMFQLPLVTWIRFGAWLALGGVIYLGYGYRRSRLRSGTPAPVREVTRKTAEKD